MIFKKKKSNFRWSCSFFKLNVSLKFRNVMQWGLKCRRSLKNICSSKTLEIPQGIVIELPPLIEAVKSTTPWRANRYTLLWIWNPNSISYISIRNSFPSVSCDSIDIRHLFGRLVRICEFSFIVWRIVLSCRMFIYFLKIIICYLYIIYYLNCILFDWNQNY